MLLVWMVGRPLEDLESDRVSGTTNEGVIAESWPFRHSPLWYKSNLVHLEL